MSTPPGNTFRLCHRLISAGLALLTLLVGSSCAHKGRLGHAQAAAAVAITNTTVIDVATGQLRSNMTVLIEGNRITAVAPRPVLPPQTQTIDGTSKFLIPGLWDMHTHHQVTDAGSVDLFVAHGVTGTRDMGSDVDFILPLRARIARGELLGPEIVAAGPILDDRPPDWPLRRNIKNAADARLAVRELREQGVDFIKVHDATPREAFFAIAEECAKLGLPFAGHVPINVTLEEAADLGLKSIEHLANFRVFHECSTAAPHGQIPCDLLYRKFASNNVWHTPTVAFWQAIPDTFASKTFPHSQYASDSLMELMRKNAELSNLDEATLASIRTNANACLQAIKKLHSFGIGILAGSDGLVPGFSLIDELEWLSKAGLTPLEVLQTATINPAKFLNRQNQQGQIAPGHRADLVLLKANPLVDIRNLRQVSAVFVRGTPIQKPALKRIIASHRRITPKL